MIGTTMKVVQTDGTEHLVPVTLKAAVEFERHFKIGLLKAMTEEQRMEQVAYLGWAALKATGAVVKLFDGWLDGVSEVSFVFDAPESAGKETTT